MLEKIIRSHQNDVYDSSNTEIFRLQSILVTEFSKILSLVLIFVMQGKQLMVFFLDCGLKFNESSRESKDCIGVTIENKIEKMFQLLLMINVTNEIIIEKPQLPEIRSIDRYMQMYIYIDSNHDKHATRAPIRQCSMCMISDQ